MSNRPPSSSFNYLLNLQYKGGPRQSQRFMRHRLETCKPLFKKDLYAHYGCVNAVEFSEDGEWLVSGGDDKRVLLWNVEKILSNQANPKAMKGEHNSNIFCLSFDVKREKLFSAGNDEQVIQHDVATADTSNVFLHDEAVYGLAVDPFNQNIFASACDDGRVLVWDVRASSTDAFLLARYASAFHAVMYNPQEPRLLVTANAKEGVGLWDIRKPRVALIRYGTSLIQQSAMSVKFNSTGTLILALRRRLPPVLFEVSSAQPAAQFDHKEYYNSCTMKSCCFAGENDEYVLSGSDDFKLYMWKVPDNVTSEKGLWVNEIHSVLRGHRSIVNQVRFNRTYGILASSGVEKIIKLWSPFAFGSKDTSHISNSDGLRKVYSHEEYINLVLESGQFMTHDYSHHCMQEDPRMMAFFDSLVQRDIEGWTSDSSETSNMADMNSTCFEVQSGSSSSSSSSSSDSPYTSSDEQEDNQMRRLNQKDNTRYLQTLPGFGSFATTIHRSRMYATDDNDASLRHDDFTSDKISELIAKKRHTQMVKNAKMTMRLKKRLRKMKNEALKHQSAAEQATKAPPMLEDPRSNLVAILRKRIDRRKFLQRKRARLLRDPDLTDDSSDSDDNEQAVDLSQARTQTEETTVPEGQQSRDIDQDVDEIANGATSQDTSEELPHCSTQKADNNDVNVAKAVGTSNGSTFFQPKNGKRHSRNYRKRSADDLQNDSSSQ